MLNAMALKIEQANQELIAKGKVESIPTFFARDYVVHFDEGKTARGHAAIEGAIALMRHAFPEVQVQVEILVQGEQRIAWQRTLRGLQKGAYRGFPASQRQIVWREMVTSEFRDGVIVEEWLLSDLAERLLLAQKH